MLWDGSGRGIFASMGRNYGRNNLPLLRLETCDDNLAMLCSSCRLLTATTGASVRTKTDRVSSGDREMDQGCPEGCDGVRLKRLGKRTGTGRQLGGRQSG